jgi:hypothetical protein
MDVMIDPDKSSLLRYHYRLPIELEVPAQMAVDYSEP